jgi:hypothetical protein
MSEIDEKPKRKSKPHQRSRLFIGTGIFLTIFLLIMLTWMFVLWVGVLCSFDSMGFDILSTQIAATNDAVRTLIYQTQIASTPSP